MEELEKIEKEWVNLKDIMESYGLPYNPLIIPGKEVKRYSNKKSGCVFHLMVDLDMRDSSYIHMLSDFCKEIEEEYIIRISKKSFLDDFHRLVLNIVKK